tara:strand:+ start:139 stop:465 length:327 start_codon:yes stop_codon:yes gene_type:complete
MNCLNCNAEFEGRRNKVYCSRICKKRAEKQKEKMKRLIVQIPHLRAQAEAAQSRGDWHGKRLSMARASAAQTELEQLSDQPLFRHTPAWLAPLITCLIRIENHTQKRP